jgi:hypothetical protein
MAPIRLHMERATGPPRCKQTDQETLDLVRGLDARNTATAALLAAYPPVHPRICAARSRSQARAPSSLSSISIWLPSIMTSWLRVPLG